MLLSVQVHIVTRFWFSAKKFAIRVITLSAPPDDKEEIMKRKLGLSKIKENGIQTISSCKTNIFFNQVIFTPRIYNDKKKYNKK